MPPIKQTAVGHPVRFIPEWRHDPYQSQKKWSDPTRCPRCGAVFSKGRWCWSASGAAKDASVVVCPACQRQQDGNPAGYLTIEGSFFDQHLNEIEGLIQHIIERERNEHPLKRLMARERTPEGSWLYTFTEPHLAVQVGEQLKRAYDGTLETDYQESAYEVRVHWCRENA